MKKFLKIFGIAMAGLFGLVAMAVAIAAISGLFSEEEIKVESLSWEVTKARIVDDYTATVNFLPENANVLDVELKLLTAGAENIVEVPATVKAGTPFTIKVKKDANGNNIGGEVKIQAKTSLVVTDPNLDILVDVPIPNNGLLISSDHDCAEGDKVISAGTSEFGMYVYTNPNMALNPNTGLVPDLAESYKNIQIRSTDTDKLQILNTTGVTKEGFYCPNYIAHGHKGPFKDSNGNALTQYCNGVKLEKYKFIEYRAKALTSTAANVPVIVTAKSLRTYSMQEQYVSKDDPKYNNLEGEGRELYYNDLSNYVNEFKDYIIADTRPNVDSQNPSLVNFENGAAFIESVTKTNDAGESYIDINESRIQEEAAYFYFFVECRTVFNIEDIEVENVKTNIQNKVEYNLHGALEQYNVDDLKAHFGLSLIASNEEFDENDLAYRYRDLRVISIMDKAEDSESNYSFDFSNHFEIQNPSSTAEPIWTIRAINPISTADRSRNPRLRFYIPSSPTKEFTSGDPYTDVGIEIQEIQVEELKLLTDGNNMIDATMIINTQDYNGYSYRQILDNTRYSLTGVGKKTPTYTTVKYFVTEESAKTKFEGTDTSFFKVKLNNDDKTPTLKTMPYGSSSVKGYEVAYQFNGQTCLEAINITNGDDLKIFAAVIKTDYNGKPVDANGVSEGQEGYNGIYQIVAKSTNTISITINNYLEKLNIYTVNSDNVYALRNVQATGAATQDTIQLLAGQDYTLKVSPFYLTKSGEIDLTHPEYANGTIIDYKTNLLVATRNASTAAEIMFNTDSTDFTYDVTPTLNSDVIVYDVNINALVDSTANPAEKRDADFNAYGVGSISESFDRTKSTINMYVNYASIDEFQLQTSVEEIKDKYVLYPQVYEMDEDGQPKVTWVEESVLSNKDTTPFSLQTYYTYDIEKLTDNADGSKSYGPKVDKNIGTSLYVNNYIREFLNFSNSNAVNVSWNLSLISGGNPGETVDSYARIVEEEAPEGSDQRSITKLVIEKGTKQGVEILATCTLGLYRTTGDNFVEQKSVSIIFELVQTDVSFTLYSPRTEKVGEDNNKFILVENGTDALSYEVEGGKGDFTNQFDASKGYNLLRDYGDQVYDVYEYVNGEYVAVAGKTASKYVKVSMGDDGKLALYCTYEIESLGGKTPSIYFLDDEGNKVYKSTPDDTGSLYFYAEYVSEDTTEKIIITPPFKDTATKPYYVKVLSSIDLTMPTSDITACTTKSDFIDLTDYYVAKRDSEILNIGFEITDKNGGNAFAGLQKADGATPIPVLNDDGTVTEDYQYLTKFVPYEVNSDKVVYMNMFYFVPEEIPTGETDEFTGDPIYRTVYVKNVIANNENINVIVKPGYEIDKKLDSITNKETTPFKIKSGNTFDLFDTNSHIAVTGKNITSGFIKITNLNNSTIGTLEEAQITTYLPKLITLAYDLEALDPADRTIFETLFEDANSKNQIENGKLITKSIASDIIIPIKVLFKEGSNSYSSSYVATIDPIFTFYVKVEASVDFYISDTVKPEGTDYSTDEISYKDSDGVTVTVAGSQVGHVYNNINIDKDSDGVLDLGEYKTTLFDSSKTYAENILSLRGTDGNELLDTMYKSYYLYKLVNDEFVHVATDDKVTIEVTKSEDQTELELIVLNITNAVNETTYYKLALSTTINKESETFDYYFAINPTYKLKANYPLVNEKEKVVVGSRINLLENYINENDRIQVYANFVMVAGGDAKEFIYTITPTAENTYSFTTTNATLDKTFELSSSAAPFNFEVLSGPAHIEDGIVVFEDFASTASIQDVKVRVTLFNGVYIDYEFELYKTLTTTTFTTQKNITAYAATQLNIYDYLELTSTPPDNFRYIIKYVGSLEATIENTDGSETILDPTTFAADSNKIINYSGAEIKVTFEDTDVITDVMFKVWTNYSISGENYVALNIKLYPNLQVVKNTDTNGNDKVISIVANSDTVVMSASDDSWLKISNDVTSNVTLSVIKVDDVDYNMYSEDASVDYLGIDISANHTNKTYTFRSKNVGIVRKLTFKVEKVTQTLTYSMEFSINLIPNINLNSAYLGSSVCDITAASAYDANKVKHVTLNNVAVDDGYIINPTDYFGNALDVQEGTTKTDSNIVTSFTVDCYIINNAGQRINADETYGVKGCIANKASINLSLIPINYESRIYIDIQITWANGVEPYKATLNLNIVPNIVTASEGVKYSSGQSLTVLAGSKIYLDFADNTPIKFEQNNSTATINALQTKSDGGTSNANVIFKVENLKDDLYMFGVDAGGSYIQFKGVTKTETINVFYYLDLSGEIMGLFTENSSLVTSNIKFLDFDSQIFVHYDNQNKNPNDYASLADKIENYSRKIAFRIVPSITSMVYADSVNKHETAETAIDITKQFKTIYANVEVSGETVNSITINDETFGLGNVNDHASILSGNNQVEVHGFKIAELFSYTPVSYGTFTDETGKVALNKSLLYSAFDYSVVVKLGNFDTAWGSTSDMTTAETPTNYFFVDKPEGVIYFIPPKGASTTNTVWLEVTVSSIGEGDIKLSQVVYFKFQYTGTQKDDSVADSKTEHLGNGSEIISVKGITETPFTSVGSLDYTAYLNTADAVSGGIDLNRGITYNLDQYFKIGYLLRTVNNDSIATAYNETKNIQIVQQEGKAYYFYLLNNVQLSYELKGESTSYAKIENGVLIPENYYINTENVNISEFRTITLAVSAGSVVTEFQIYIYPIKARQNFTCTNNVFENELITSASLQNVDIVSNEVELVQGSLTTAEYNEYKQWLKLENGKYIFKPDASKLYNSVTFTFSNEIKLGTGIDATIFEKLETVTVDPIVGLHYNYEETGVKANINEQDTALVLSIIDSSTTTSLFKSNVFAHGGSATTIIESIVLTETSDEADYEQYVIIEGTTIGADANVYTITDSSARITIKNNQLLENVELPYKMEIKFKNNGYDYVLTKEFDLVINRNSGVFGFEDAYTNLDNVVVVKDGDTYDSAKIVLSSSKLGGNAKLIGSGTISYEVSSENFGSYGYGTLSPAEILAKLDIQTDISTVDGTINSITIDYVELLRSGKITGLYKIELLVYYVDTNGTKTLVDKVILESTIKTINITSNYKNSAIDKGSEYVIVDNTINSIFRTDLYEIASSQIITLTQNDDYSSDVTVKDSTSNIDPTDNNYAIGSSSIKLVVDPTSSATTLSYKLTIKFTVGDLEQTIVYDLELNVQTA